MYGPGVWAVSHGQNDLRTYHNDKELLAVNMCAIRDGVRICPGGADVIHLHTPLFTQAAIYLSRKWGKPLVYTCHFPAALYMDNAAASGKRRIEAAEERIFENAAAIVGVSDWMTQIIERSPHTTRSQCIRTVHNGVDVGMFCPSQNSHRQFLLFVGRLSKQKGMDSLPRIMQYIQKQRPVHLIVCGTGDREHWLREELRGCHADVIGFQHPRNVVKWLQGAFALLMPSIWDPCPVAVLEAAASGTPVVGTDIPGLRELVRKGDTGVLVARRGNWPKMMARQVLRLWDDPTLRRRMGRRGRALAEREFSMSAMVSKVLAVYRDVMRLSVKPTK